MTATLERPTADTPAAASSLRVVVAQETLKAALGIVTKAISGKAVMPVLSNVLLDATPEGLRLTATDLSVVLSVSLAHGQRCTNPKNKGWDKYGGRGITVCEAWRTFEGFYRDMGDPPPGMTLDRIDVNGNYEPGNCRWATVERQARNKRGSLLFTFRGETKPLADWAEEFGLRYQRVFYRMQRDGWSLERALTTPVNGKGVQTDPEDEKHLCPFPVPLVERCIRLWSNPGDLVLDPFGGIATTPVAAIRHGRRGLAFELKPAYYRQGVGFLQAEEFRLSQPTLFDTGLVLAGPSGEVQA